MQWGARSMCSQPPGPSRGEAAKVLSVGGGSGGECGERGGFREVSSVGGGVGGGGSGRDRRALWGPVRVVGARGCRRGPEGAAGIRGCCGGWCAQPGTEGAAGTGSGSRNRLGQPRPESAAGIGARRAGGWMALRDQRRRGGRAVPPGSDGAAGIRRCRADQRAPRGPEDAGTGGRRPDCKALSGPGRAARSSRGRRGPPGLDRARGRRASGPDRATGQRWPGPERAGGGPSREVVGAGAGPFREAVGAGLDRSRRRRASAATPRSPPSTPPTTGSTR